MRRKTITVVILAVAMLSTLITLFGLFGCAIGYAEDENGQKAPMIGTKIGDYNKNAEGVIANGVDGFLKTIGLGGLAGGGGLGVLAASLWAKSARRRGQSEGWDERDRDLAQNKLYATGASAPPTSQGV